VAPQLVGLTGTKLVFAEAGLNTLAAAGAGWINCALMRQKELFEGVEVQDEAGEVTYGKSKAAGRSAIFQTALTRIILPVPVLFFPAFANLALNRFGLWPKNVKAGKMAEFALCIGSLTLALPLSIALF